MILDKVVHLEKIPKRELDFGEYQRYSRQLILPDIGRLGQVNIVNSSVLIVGCGGLGCPVIQYLAVCGVGRIGLVDFDNVEISNIQRQVLHYEANNKISKVVSAKESILALNSAIDVVGFQISLDSSNAMELVSQFDCVVDCTDNVATRYLLNDSCYFANIPLVSGAALRWDGQVCVFLPDKGCYRCLHPKPPSPDSVTNCSDGGVIGSICGVIGSIQATETIKLLAKTNGKYSLNGKMIIYDGLRSETRTIKLRGKKVDCPLCSTKIIKELVDYVEFCQAGAHDKSVELNILDVDERLHPIEANETYAEAAVFVDVRPSCEYEIANLSDKFKAYINYPLKRLQKDVDSLKIELQKFNKKKIVCVCRMGNDSQLAVQLLKSKLTGYGVYDIKKGLYGWNEHIDSSFPLY